MYLWSGAGEGCEADRLDDRIHNLDLEQDKMFLCCSMYAIISGQYICINCIIIYINVKNVYIIVFFHSK